MAAPGACKGGYKPPVEIWAAVRRPRGFCSRRGLVQPGCTPRFLFRLAEKKTGRARSKRKGRLDALRCSDPPRATGVGVSVPAPIWTGLRARYALLRFLLLPSRGGWRRPRRGGCRMELLLFSLPLTLPRRIRQRVAQRNARKEERVKCVLAPRFLSEPRRGSQCSSLHRTPPRPSGGHRKPAGTISRQLPYSNFARTCKVVTKSVFSLTPGAARSLFGADKKRMGGASPVETAPWREPVSPGG